MFAKNKVSQSMIDAVNKIMSEKEEETKEQFLSEGWDEMLKSVKDKNKPQPSGGAGKKQGSRYGGSKQKEEPEEKEVKEEKSDEPFKPKKYTGTSKQLMQPEFKLGPKPQPKNEELKGNQHKIDKNKNNKIDAHDFQLLRGRKKVKEDTFAAKLLNSLDETRGAQAMKASGVKQSPDKLLARTGMNMAHKFPRPGQTNLGNIPGMNTPGVSKSTADYAEKRRGDRAKELKPAIKAASGTHGPKGKLPEEVELTEDYDSKLNGIANKHGFKKKDSLIGVHLEHPKHGRISLTHAGAWTHDKPIHSGEGQYKGSGMATHKTIHSGHGLNNLDKHLSSLSEEVELNEVSKSEIDHHYDDWINSTGAPHNKDAGDDKKVHDSAMRHLRNKYPPIPKEKHEKLAMHMAHLYHGSGIDEAAPKKMDDVAKQNLTPAKKGVVGTVKSDFKNFKNFLAGKKETNEAINSNKQTIDTLAGRSKKVPKEAKIDNDHSSAKVELKSEEVEQLDEDRWLMKYLLSKGINPEFVSRNQKVAHAKSNEFKKYRRDHQQEESVQTEAAKSPIFRPKPTDYNNATKARARRNTGLPFAGPYTKVSADPMQRARSMAQSAMQSVKDKQNQPTTMDKVKSAVDKTKRVATKTFMTAFKP